MAVVQSNTEKGYRLATKQGILLGSYTRNQFEPIDSLFLKPSNILADNFILFRQAVRWNSICDGQGFQTVVISNPVHVEVYPILHPVSSTNKTDRRLAIAEILLNVALNLCMHHH
jgi:hypothetical protein